MLAYYVRGLEVWLRFYLGASVVVPALKAIYTELRHTVIFFHNQRAASLVGAYWIAIVSDGRPEDPNDFLSLSICPAGVVAVQAS
jgi:hypothetical protein